MCGRFVLDINGEQLSESFDLSDPILFEPRYNIAPGQSIPAIRRNASGENYRSGGHFHWGLVPSWADDPEDVPQPINARSETVDKKPMFRNAFEKRRCLIPSTGFYEWKRTNGEKQPFLIRLTSGSPFAFAGIWEKWTGKNEKETTKSCAILTTQPNELIRPVHDRMPVILHPSRYETWLDPSSEPDRLLSFLTPYQSSKMERYPVSKKVNNPEFDDPSCAERIS